MRIYEAQKDTDPDPKHCFQEILIENPLIIGVLLPDTGVSNRLFKKPQGRDTCLRRVPYGILYDIR